MRKWTLEKRLKGAGQASTCVLDCDLVIVPVHLGVHWTCAVVSFRDQEIVYLDSMKVPAYMPAWADMLLFDGLNVCSAPHLGQDLLRRTLGLNPTWRWHVQLYVELTLLQPQPQAVAESRCHYCYLCNSYRCVTALGTISGAEHSL